MVMNCVELMNYLKRVKILESRIKTKVTIINIFLGS